MGALTDFITFKHWEDPVESEQIIARSRQAWRELRDPRVEAPA